MPEMIRREGHDPLHYTISRRGKKLNNTLANMSVQNPITMSPASEVIVGATEEIIEEEEVIEEGVPNIITSSIGQQYVQTPAGLVKVEEDVDFEDHIIYRSDESNIEYEYPEEEEELQTEQTEWDGIIRYANDKDDEIPEEITEEEVIASDSPVNEYFTTTTHSSSHLPQASATLSTGNASAPVGLSRVQVVSASTNASSNAATASSPIVVKPASAGTTTTIVTTPIQLGKTATTVRKLITTTSSAAAAAESNATAKSLNSSSNTATTTTTTAAAAVVNNNNNNSSSNNNNNSQHTTTAVKVKGVIRDDKDQFKCLYLLVETAVAVRQREKEQDDVHVLGN